MKPSFLIRVYQKLLEMWNYFSKYFHLILFKPPAHLSFSYVFQVLLVVKNPFDNAEDIRDPGLIPGWGWSPGEGNGNPLQYSCLENPMDRRAWRATVHRVAKSWTELKWISTHTMNLTMYWPIKEGSGLKWLKTQISEIGRPRFIPWLFHLLAVWACYWALLLFLENWINLPQKIVVG